MDALKFSLSSFKPEPQRLFVGVSGGLDSVVLLDMLCRFGLIPQSLCDSSLLKGAEKKPPLIRGDERSEGGINLTVLHVNHQLQKEADHWAIFVKNLAKKYACDFAIEYLNPKDFVGRNIEAEARRGRYAFFEKHLTEPDDALFLAHHQQDQVETFFLNLQRGAGLAGLAAMPASRPFGKGYLVRPLLSYSRAMLENYANTHGLQWIEDPSNEDLSLNRNFLRKKILPLLHERWPHFDAHAFAAITHLQEARAVLDYYLQHDVQKLGNPLQLKIWQTLPQQSHKLLLQHWLKQHSGKILSDKQLSLIIEEVIGAAEDREPLFEIPGLKLRRQKMQLVLE